MGSIRSSKMATTLILMVMIIAPNVKQLAGLTVSSDNFESGRQLKQTKNASEQVKQSDDTVRADPLDHLRKYRGGYDITNMHYWSSTAFTGIYGYAIAAIWAICGLIYGAYSLVTSFCWKTNREEKFKKTSSCRKKCYPWSRVLVVLFTILAIIGCGLFLGGNAKFHSRATTVVDILIDTADHASDTIYNTTEAMKDLSANLAADAESGDATRFLKSTAQSLDTEADDIHRQARKHRRAIYNGLKIVYIITTVTISLNLVAAIALSVSGVLKLRRILRLMVILCWILTVLCWLFSGIYFFIENFADDTCTALEGFRQDPYNNSLSSILPCDELSSAKSVLRHVSAEVYNVVHEVNSNISTRYGNIFQICNPFSGPPHYHYQPQDCPANAYKIGDIPQLLKQVTCPDSEQGCTGGIVIPTKYYNRLEIYTTSIQRLLNEYPDMESLVECQTVTTAFSEILNTHCKPLKRYTRMVWAAMVFLSTVMVALILLWTTEAHYEQYQHSSDGSMKPFSTSADKLESGTAEAPNNGSIPSSVL
ncbi:uncharacterized protein LOC113764456 [Coffea eugenioides]|uniref:uncharacterized protein LOC113764456 n=1 Tax=Coffea eugenioides TaxID=49369 RepID=UPI000F60798D|nr:uncharacterized protein LOC113764456 [Coffea eugenioides]